MKKLLIIFSLLFSLNALSQTPIPFSSLTLYTGSLDSVKYVGLIKAGNVWANRVFYGIDLVKGRLNISDTAAMLANYYAATIQRVRFSDTASMLSPYERSADLIANFYSKTQSDGRYLQSVDSSNIPNFFLKVRAGLSTVAVSGAYNDLTGKPTIPTNTNQLTNGAGFLSSIDTTNITNFFLKVRAGLSTVAVSGSYNDLSNKPTIPTNTNQLTNGAGFLSSVDTTNITNFFLKVRAGLSTAAVSGSYNDLSNKPTIPAAQQNTDWTASSGITQLLNKPVYLDSFNLASRAYAQKIKDSLQANINTKQATLVSATNIKTINGNTLLGSGDLVISGGVTTVFGRSGAVVAQTGDYTFSQIGSPPTTLGGYGITDAYTKTQSDANYYPIAGGLLAAGGYVGFPKLSSSPLSGADRIFEFMDSAGFRAIRYSSNVNGGYIREFIPNITANRQITWPDKNGTLATLSDNITGTASNITGTLNATSFPALTGDITTPGGSLATTLATVNSNVFGSNTLLKFAVNGKGLITGAASVVAGDIPNLAESQIINLSTDLSNKQPITTVVTGLTSAGTNQATALALSGANSIQEITTAASGTGALLPTPSTSSQVIVINRGANNITLYPASGHTINNQSANIGYTVPAGSVSTFLGKSGTAWYTENAFTGGDANTTDGSGLFTVSGIKGASVPTLSNGLLRNTAGAWSFDNATYLTAAVTSVATGFGISGGTITGTGTLLADTLAVTTLALLRKYEDSVKAVYPNSTNALNIGGVNFSLGPPGQQRTWSIGVSLPGQVARMTAASSAINTTETAILSSPTIAANQLTAGSSYRVTIHGTCTSTVANASNFRVRIGNTGGNTDAVVGVITPTAAASGTTIPFAVEFTLTVRTNGSSGTMEGSGQLLNNGVTGVSAATPIVGTTQSITVNTTVTNIISVWYVSAATTTTSTFQDCWIECVKI